jgi:nucleotide-binding universal stress UspA family protein
MANSTRKKILVAVDGSEHALHAVRYTAKTVPADAVDIVLFHIVTKVPESFFDLQSEPVYHYRIADIREWEARQEEMLRDFMAQACEVLYAAGVPRDSVKINIQERRVGIARDIIAESQRGYHTVVVGRRGLSELKDFVLGSIATKLVEKLVHVPIWIVGAKQQRGRFLVSVDASEGAMLAVNYLSNLLSSSPLCEVTLFHVVREADFFHQMIGRVPAQTPDKAWKERLEKELEPAECGVKAIFTEAADCLIKAGISPDRVCQKIVRGPSNPSSVIVEEAEQSGCDTLVVGRRGLSKVQEFFMGRVSNKVIQLAKDKSVWVVS